MIKIKDGRTELYQWDTGSILTVGEGIDEVHFARSPMGRSITAPVANGEAKVEDVLLQTAGKLFVWGFVGTAEDGYTKLEREFTVRARNKPADYVFTPPEQITLAEILEELERVQGVVTPEAVGALVEEYLRENPVDGAVKIDDTLTREGFAADAAAVGREVTQLSKEIADLDDQLSVANIVNINKTTLEYGGLTYGAGEPDVNNNVMRMDGFVPVKPNTLYQIYSERDKSDDVIYVFQYDASKTFIQYTSAGKFYDTGLTTPENCYYIRTRTQTNGANNYTLPPLDTRIMVEEGSVKTFAFDGVVKTVITDELKRFVGQLKPYLINKTSLEYGGLTYGAGEPDVNNNVMRMDDFVPVKPNTLYQIYSERDKPEDTVYVFQYDASKTFIQYTSAGKFYETGLTTPENCYYIRTRTQTNGAGGYTLPPLDTRIMVEEGSVKTFAFDGIVSENLIVPANEKQPIFNALKQNIKDTASEDDISRSLYVEYGRLDGATYNFVRIPRISNDGNTIRPVVSLTPEDGGLIGTKCSPLTYSRKNKLQFVINAGLFNTTTIQPVGQTIIDGVSVTNTPMTDDNGRPISETECYPLCIDAEGNLSAPYARSIDTSTMIADGVKYAVTGWGKLVDNFEIAQTEIDAEIVHKDKNYSRQCIGQFENGDYCVLTTWAGGYTTNYQNEAGMTYEECAQILVEHGVKFAYSLDGGGSAGTVIKNRQINPIYEGTHGRSVPSVIYFTTD